MAKHHDEFYVDEEDGIWYVFGTETGKAYSSWASEEQAENDANKRNKLIKGK